MGNRGTVAFASKPMRGSRGAFPAMEGFTRVDVSSGSMFFLPGRIPAKSLSPLLLEPVTPYEDGEVQPIRFENLWQYTKVYPQLGHWDNSKNEPSDSWYAWRDAGFQKVNNGKGIRTPPEVATLKKKKSATWAPRCAWWKGKELDYLSARKQIYIPEYIHEIRRWRKENAMDTLHDMIKDGMNVLLIEHDGPELSKFPEGFIFDKPSQEVVDFFVHAIHDTSKPFGHGYIIAAELVGVDLLLLCK